MSKAVLVLDMPSSCNDCICRYINTVGKTICMAKIEELKPKRNKRPDWCPLRELPEKKMIEIVQEDYNGGYSHGFTHGYNACIDELLKGKEG